MSLALHIRTGDWNTLGEAAYRIRYQVFVVEQGVPIAMEHDEADAVSLHVVAQAGGKAVATGRLLPDGHIGRVAVLSAWRGRGIGRRVMQSLMDHAIRQGHIEAMLHAQAGAEGFYTALGFVREGDIFMEAAIAHLAMRKRL